MGATLSIRGLFQYDPSLFENMLLPEGVDKETLVQNLIAELAEVEVIYPSPVVMKPLIGVWSRKELPVWEKLYKTTTLTYNPINNYDRNEEWVDSGSTTVTETNSGSDTAQNTQTESGSTKDTQTNSGNDTTTNTTTDTGSTKTTETNSGNDTANSNDSSTTTTSAFNSSALEPAQGASGSTSATTTYGHKIETEQTLNNVTKTQNGSTTYGRTIENTHTLNDVTTSQNNSTTYGRKTVSQHDINNVTKTGRAWGNIGVTTTQQMLTEEREVSQFNIYDFIIDSFCEKIYHVID